MATHCALSILYRSPVQEDPQDKRAFLTSPYEHWNRIHNKNTSSPHFVVQTRESWTKKNDNPLVMTKTRCFPTSAVRKTIQARPSPELGRRGTVGRTPAPPTAFSPHSRAARTRSRAPFPLRNNETTSTSPGRVKIATCNEKQNIGSRGSPG